MAHSFFAPTPANTIENYTTNNEYFHPASKTYYRMERRGDEYFQLRWQVGYQGKQTNIDEKRIDYVIGSGHHARTYLHRNPNDTLSQLPLGWYAERGGYFAMSPGYDKPDHPAATRPITYDCMFCHNAYPSVPPKAEPRYNATLPEGIDCTRCHGQTSTHFLNPAKLTPERKLEVCMQCHLQPSSLPPDTIVKRDTRPWFSYNSAEPLSKFLLYFGRAKPDDHFEIDSSAYRLRKSACFLQSKGALQCTTCHNPHNPHNQDYDAACKTCHSTLTSARHPQTDHCAGCHMPQRRTDDVVNAVVTDHFIQRQPTAHPSVPNRSPLVPYYPAQPIAHPKPQTLPVPPDRHNIAGVKAAQASDLPKAEAEFREAIRILPSSGEAHSNLANVLALQQDNEQALYEFAQSVELLPNQTSTRFSYATLLNALHQFSEAKIQVATVIKQQPKLAEAHDLLGNLYEREGDKTAATDEYRLAIKLNPKLTQAKRDLAAMLSSSKQ